MTTPSTLRTMLRRALWPAAMLIVLSFFGGYAVLGPNGVLAYGQYKRELAVKQAQFARLDKQRAVLKNRVDLLDPKHVDPDMADELTRKQLGVVAPDEVILPLH
ncbi:FtsB family cell division protein [Hephaestia mangrovi]|uniref:FtsB family cell division protein n=1 Tax=Hephaestia mangrovi TaxID=2873268 RepID=UPI001CA61B6C|nr:septum formation initiator family protein [Hephaestia mangrovi]MBY8827665.1 septum formation initiator family protein [Hephaestia mangrovi]